MTYTAGVPESPDEARLRSRIEKALERDDPVELEQLVIEVALESDDRIWAECTCAQLARHRSAGVRGGALLGFGHLARRFGADHGVARQPRVLLVVSSILKLLNITKCRGAGIAKRLRRYGAN